MWRPHKIGYLNGGSFSLNPRGFGMRKLFGIHWR